jgi:hypothetical protein
VFWKKIEAAKEIESLTEKHKVEVYKTQDQHLQEVKARGEVHRQEKTAHFQARNAKALQISEKNKEKY